MDYIKNVKISNITINNKEFSIVDIISSLDSSIQKAFFYSSNCDKPQPLLVHLHEWSCDYKIFLERPTLGILSKKAGYNYIFPDFRGSNITPESCASEKVLNDIDDAIDFAIKNANVDINKIVIVGLSGGGHLTLAMYLRSRHKVKYFSAWCPISDIEQWYYQTKYANLKYYKDIEQICGNPLNTQSFVEMKKRSPLYMDFINKDDRKGSKLEIYHGINDGYTGSIPTIHSLMFYNKVAGTISASEIIQITTRNIKDNSEEFIENRKIIFKHENNNTGLFIFEGSHEMLIDYAFERLKHVITI